MRADELRRWAASRRSAEEHEFEASQPAPDPETSWRQALSLFALLGRMVGWPVPPDAVRSREDAQAFDAWTRLRRAYRVAHDR